MRDGLTPKQHKFAAGIVAGLNPSEAYRAAGYAAKNPDTVAHEAQRLLNNPHISLIVEQGKKEAMTKAIWTRRRAMEQLRAINDQLFREITERRDLSSPTLRAYFDSCDRLNALADIPFELSLRQAVYRQEADTMGNFSFNDYHQGIRAMYEFDAEDFESEESEC